MKKILCWIIAFLLISSVSAFQPKDRYVKLIDNTGNCYTMCYTIYEVTAYDRELTISPDFDFKTGYDQNKREWTDIPELREIEYFWLSTENYKTMTGKDDVREKENPFNGPITLKEGESIRVKISGIKEPSASIDNIFNLKLNSNILKMELFDKTYSYDEWVWWSATQGSMLETKYYEDFETSSTNWTVVNFSIGMTGNWTRSSEGGNYVMNQSNVTTTGTPEFVLNFTKAIIPYAANITVKVLKSDFRDNQGFSGIQFNTSKRGLNYACTYTMGNISNEQYVDWKIPIENYVHTFDINSSQWYWLKAEIIGNDIKLYTSNNGNNFQLQATTTISDDCKGSVGLMHVYGLSPTIFDNFEMITQTFTDAYFINASYYTDVNETAITPFCLYTNWTGSSATLVWNGTPYNATILTNASGHSNFSVNVTVPLVDANTTATFYWNYTVPNMTWTNKSVITQNVKMSYYIKLDENRLNSSYMETEIFKAYFNLTNFSNNAIITPSFVADATAYLASFNQSVSNYLQQYNGSIKTPNATSTSFNLAGIINVSFGGKSIIRTSNKTILIAKADIFLCTDSQNTTTARFFIYDEDALTPLNTSNFEGIFKIWSISNPTGAITINFTSAGETNYSFCLQYNNTIYSDIYIKYGARFTHRYYLINESLSNVAKNFSLYNFIPIESATSTTTSSTYPATTSTTTTVVNITDAGGNYTSTSTSTTGGYTVNATTPITQALSISGLKITARNAANYNYKTNIIGKLQRWYVGENVWRTVQMDKSGDYGLLYYDIKEKDIDYRFIFVNEDDCILKTTSNLKFVCTNLICDVTYLLGDCSSTLSDNFSVTVTYSNETGNITTSWDDPAGGTTVVHTTTTRETLTGTMTICDTTISGASGAYSCGITGYTGTFMTSVTSTTNGVTNNKITVYTESAGTKIMNLISSGEGALWSFGIMLTVAMFGVFSPVGAVITCIIGLIMLFYLGLFSPITMSLTIVAAVLGIVIGLLVKT